MKVLFEASILNNFDSKNTSRSGIYWTCYNLLKELSKNPEIKLYLYGNNHEKLFQFTKQFDGNAKIFAEDIKNMDVCFSPCFKISDNIKKSGIPCFTLLYDCTPIIYAQYFQDSITSWFTKVINSLNNNDYCFSISEHTKKDFLKYRPQLDANKITTIPLSTNLPYKPNKNLSADIRKKYNIPSNKKYLFSLCTLEPRKNLIRSVKTFIEFIEKNKIDDLVFVLGGGSWDGFIEKFEHEVPEYAKYKDKIIRAGYVDDEDMEVLYSNAEWFVYTSQYEGFGMPPLEAMACGTAVITSNNSSLPEVVGDAGIMIDWNNDEQHIAAYEKYYYDKKFRNEMAKKGLERSKLFSWKKAADIIIEQFKKCKPNGIRTSLFLVKNQTISVNLFFLKLFTIKEFFNETTIRLFNLLPILKIETQPNKLKVKLFCLLPLFQRKVCGNTVKYKIFGISIFKVKTKNHS